ncbi:MAG: hypothetical protein FJ109_18260, partial [Deltaproteobacteria bacterium]|nr:hypothetical protein [Deltaproteobacteria bacterium]
MKERISVNMAAAALAALALCVLDSVALHAVRPGVFASNATSLQFLLVTLGGALSLFLPAALVLALAGEASERARCQWVGIAGAAMSLAFCTWLLNQRFSGNKVWFLAVLVAGAAALGGLLRLSLVRSSGRPVRSMCVAGGLCLLSLVLFALDVTQLPGLYSSQHVTVGVFTWLSLHTAFLLVLSLRPALLPRAPAPRIGVLVALVLQALSVVLFWVTPGDAVGESLRWAANSGSTGTREVLHLLAGATDVDRG